MSSNKTISPDKKQNPTSHSIRFAVMIHSKLINKTRKVSNYLWFRYVKSVQPSDRPIFIVGCGHSGTSILLSILSAHSNIYAYPFESRMAVEDDKHKFWETLKVIRFNAVASGKAKYVEKTPKHIAHIGKILAWKKNAKILLIIRDGRDVAYSLKKRTGDLHYGVRRWVDDNRSAMRYWNHPNMLVVYYENLVTKTESTIKKVLDFVGEDYKPEVQQYYKTPKQWYGDNTDPSREPDPENHMEYRNWQINQPIFDGRGQWKEMPQEDIEFVYQEAGDLLKELRYI